jgi:hypothetical protein
MKLVSDWPHSFYAGDTDRTRAPSVQSETLRKLSVSFKVLHRALMLFRSLTRIEGTKVASLLRAWIRLAGVQPIFSGLELANHRITSRSSCGPGRLAFIKPLAAVLRSPWRPDSPCRISRILSTPRVSFAGLYSVGDSAEDLGHQMSTLKIATRAGFASAAGSTSEDPGK